jgi:quercetin dioxygenase-like cupin family protein
VLPGALLPSPDTELVTLVRAGEGSLIPVASRPDAAIGRALLMRSDNVLEVMDYVVEPGQYLSEWFELEGELAMYIVSGQIDVEIEGVDTYRLGPRDLLAHPASLRHRWTLVGTEPAHLVLAVAHPAESSR